MQAAHAREGQQVEDSGHLRPESAAAGMPGLRGLAPAGSFANPHARIRSAPPARARTSLGSPNNKAKPAPWIPSIPGRISQGLTPLVPALGVYSGTCSAASSRVPSCKSRQLLSTESQGEGQPSVSHRRVGDRMSSTHASSHNGELLTKETSFTRPCTSNILHSPRANWKCTDKGWSKLSQTSHRCALATSAELTCCFRVHATSLVKCRAVHRNPAILIWSQYHGVQVVGQVNNPKHMFGEAYHNQCRPTRWVMPFSRSPMCGPAQARRVCCPLFGDFRT